MTVPDPRQSPALALTTILERAGVITHHQVTAVLARHHETGVRSGELLVRMGMATEEDIGWALARQLDLTFVDPRPETLDRDLVRLFPEDLLRRHDALPLVLEDDCLAIALADPTDHALVDELTVAASRPLRLAVATPSAIRRALRGVYGLTSPERHVHERVVAAQFAVPQRHRDGAAFLQERLREAIAAGAGEIHLVPHPDRLDVAHRVAGKMVGAGIHPRDRLGDVLAWIESLDGPALLPDQSHTSGRVQCPTGPSTIELSVSLLRQPSGVSVTIEPLVESVEPRLDRLGLEAVDASRLREALSAPAGLGLVLGPPNAGGSTTLEALACELERDGRRCVRWHSGRSVEDGIAAALAHGADVVAVDDVPARVAATLLGPAGAGRWMLARVAADEPFAVLEHLAHDALERAALASRLAFVIQQRRAWRTHDVAPASAGTPRHCTVFELIVIDDALRDALRRGEPADALRRRAHTSDHVTLAERLQVLVSAGLVTAAEAARLA